MYISSFQLGSLLTSPTVFIRLLVFEASHQQLNWALLSDLVTDSLVLPVQVLMQSNLGQMLWSLAGKFKLYQWKNSAFSWSIVAALLFSGWCSIFASGKFEIYCTRSCIEWMLRRWIICILFSFRFSHFNTKS